MTRGDFWCRVLGWLQIGGAVATGLLIYVAVGAVLRLDRD